MERQMVVQLFLCRHNRKNNYPFPCFFRGDDVEFTIRNESKIINLNGLNVWHEPFYKKYSIVSETIIFEKYAGC